VRVTLTNLATRVVRAVATDAAGLYTAPDLLPGSYEMTVAALGFTTQVRTDITVNVGASLVLNVVMQAGDPSQVVRVAVAGTPADQASSAVGGNVSASTVRDTSGSNSTSVLLVPKESVLDNDLKKAAELIERAFGTSFAPDC